MSTWMPPPIKPRGASKMYSVEARAALYDATAHVRVSPRGSPRTPWLETNPPPPGQQASTWGTEAGWPQPHDPVRG